MNLGRFSHHVAERFVGHQVDRLDLERLDEAFRLGVIIGITRRLIEPTNPCRASRDR